MAISGYFADRNISHVACGIVLHGGVSLCAQSFVHNQFGVSSVYLRWRTVSVSRPSNKKVICSHFYHCWHAVHVVLWLSYSVVFSYFLARDFRDALVELFIFTARYG